MGNIGLGVMIRHLGGNAESVAAYTASLGKKIVGAGLVDDVLCISLDDGNTLLFTDEGQSCCERRYMTTDDTPNEFVGATFMGAEIKEAPNAQAEYDEHEVQFLEVKTDRGVFTMASHNEHTGYYGGFSIECSLRPTA